MLFACAATLADTTADEQPSPFASALLAASAAASAAALACVPLVGGIIFYVLEKHDQFVRFYAMQSIIFGGAWIVFSIIWNILFAILAHIPVLGWVFALVLWCIWAVWNIGAVIVWIIAMIKAFSGARWDIPYIGPIARNQVDGAV